VRVPLDFFGTTSYFQENCCKVVALVYTLKKKIRQIKNWIVRKQLRRMTGLEIEQSNFKVNLCCANSLMVSNLPFFT